ncbi:MAG: sigma-70 family RNA polymerase sigma factor, partial [Planctomycetota bacterium]
MEKIVAATRGRLLATARRIGDPQDAEDTVQATYHALLRRRRGPLDGPLIAWLITVTVRIAYRQKAARRREILLAHNLSVPSDELGPAQTAVRAERASGVRAEVARLPRKYRDAIVLRYLEGLSTKDCARLLDCSENTLRTRLMRGRALLRGRLHPRIASLALFIPWWIADHVRAAALTLAGLAWSPRVALVGLLIALTGVLVVSHGQFRAGGSDIGQRATRDWDPNERRVAGSASMQTDTRGSGDLHTLPVPVDLDAVDREREVHGLVVRADGSPIPGARLQILDFPWRRGGVLNEEERDVEARGPMTLSARDGTFRLSWRRGESGWLDVSAAGFAARRIPWVQAGERLRIELDQGATLVVHVRDPSGDPVPSASVVFARSPTDSPWHARIHRGE